MELVIAADGVVRCLYAESFPLTELGTVQITRASQVEPDARGQWWAELAPVAGPRLGPFPRRSQALAAEVAWLEIHRLHPASN